MHNFINDFTKYAVALVAAFVLTSAHAQEFPSKPIRIIAPQAAGGPNDILGRVLADKLKDTLKQPVVVENRAGAGGMIAGEAVARSAPDGYTLALTTASLIYSFYMLPNPPIDPLKDLGPVAMVTFTPLILAAHTKLPVKTFEELIAYAKANPDRVTIGVSSVGGSDHLAIEMVNRRAGVKITPVVYKGAAPATQDLVAGRVDLEITTYAFLKTYIDNGTLRLLATPGSTRNPFVPSIPTIQELGYPELNVPTWTGFMAPTGTPPAVIARLAAAFKQAMQLPDVIERLGTLSLVANFADSAQFGVILRNDSERLGKVITESGIKAK